MIKSIAMMIAVVAVSVAPAVAQVFDIPATGAWVKVQDGEVTQWSAIPSTNTKMRIDLVSYVENGNRITYYLIRSACSDGKVASAVIKPGNKLGVGVDCNGSMVANTATILDTVQKLPTEAAALIKQ
jgi:hypothetical protein